LAQKKYDLTAQRFTKLLVLGEEANGAKKSRRWLCRCICGNDVIVCQISLLNGKAYSCGCASIQKARIAAKAQFPKEHRIWQGMMERCTNSNFKSWSNYGGRGIQVCERWREFPNFIADMGPRPSDDHQIDRYPDNDGDYQPGNCRWATREEQQSNTRASRRLTINGVTKTVADWARISGIYSSKIRNRIDQLGWTAEQAIQPTE